MMEMLEELMGLVAEVEELLEDSSDAQWQASRYSSGTHPGHSDPTGDTAADPRRLALRAEVQNAEGTLSLVSLHVSAARTRLREALARHSGDRLDT